MVHFFDAKLWKKSKVISMESAEKKLDKLYKDITVNIIEPKKGRWTLILRTLKSLCLIFPNIRLRWKKLQALL